MATPKKRISKPLSQREALKIRGEDFVLLSQSVGAAPTSVQKTIQEMLSQGLIEPIPTGAHHAALPFRVVASAYHRVQSDLQARLLSVLLGYELTEFPRVVKADVLSEGEPVIAGTRIPVYSIIIALMNGSSIDQLQARYPEVPRQAILEALHYYLHHQEEFDQRLEREKEAEDWESVTRGDSNRIPQ